MFKNVVLFCHVRDIHQDVLVTVTVLTVVVFV